MKRITNLLAVLGLFCTLDTSAAIFLTKSGDVKFTAIGKPGFLKIRGDSKGVSPAGELVLNDKKLKGEINFDLQALDTGIGLRNDHMKEKYLEIKKYPQAKLSLEELATIDLNLDMKSEFKGKLKLHGEEKPISGQFQYSAKDKKVLANFEIKVSDFKIDIPKYLGTTVSETVQLEVAFNIVEKK